MRMGERGGKKVEGVAPGLQGRQMWSVLLGPWEHGVCGALLLWSQHCGKELAFIFPPHPVTCRPSEAGGHMALPVVGQARSAAREGQMEQQEGSTSFGGLGYKHVPLQPLPGSYGAAGLLQASRLCHSSLSEICGRCLAQ